MKILYVVHGEILAPVVRSQTFPLLRRLCERGHEVSVAAITSPRRLLRPSVWAEALEAAGRAVGGRLHVLVHPPRSSGGFLVSRGLQKALRRSGADVVHCRQARAAAVALRSGAGRVVLDMRGIRPEEYLLATGRAEADLDRRDRRRLARLRREQAEALAGASAVVCVSEPFARRLGGGPAIRVVPNASEEIESLTPERRRQVRAGLGISEEDFAVVYSGSLAPWQCAAEAVRLFRMISRAREDARLVLLTHDRAAGEALIAAEGVGAAAVRSLSPEETRAVLPAFDAALLLRHRDPVNEVAAPVKFAEYLHAGLPVVLTDGIGDASGWVRRHGLGVVLASPEDPGNADAVVLAIAGFDRERCREFARKRLSFDVTVPMYEAAHQWACEGGERRG